MKILNNLKLQLKKINRKIIAIRCKRKLLKRRTFDYELELINEKWIIKRIQDGQVQRRKELQECQARIKEIDMFIKFLKNEKI